MKLVGNIILSVLSVTALLSMLPERTVAAKEGARELVDKGQQIYMANCEACHMTGKNVIKPEKELVRSEKLANEDVFREFLKERHDVMPAFPDIAKDADSAKALFKFCRKLKRQSWEYKAPEESDQD